MLTLHVAQDNILTDSHINVAGHAYHQQLFEIYTGDWMWLCENNYDIKACEGVALFHLTSPPHGFELGVEKKQLWITFGYLNKLVVLLRYTGVLLIMYLEPKCFVDFWRTHVFLVISRIILIKFWILFTIKLYK